MNKNKFLENINKEQLKILILKAVELYEKENNGEGMPNDDDTLINYIYKVKANEI